MGPSYDLAHPGGTGIRGMGGAWDVHRDGTDGNPPTSKKFHTDKKIMLFGGPLRSEGKLEINSLILKGSCMNSRRNDGTGGMTCAWGYGDRDGGHVLFLTCDLALHRSGPPLLGRFSFRRDKGSKNIS